MTIAYDVSFLQKEKTGIGIYILNLIKHILAVDKTSHYVLFGSSFSLDVEKINSLRTENVSLKLYRVPGAAKRFLWNDLNLNIDFLIGNYDLFHSTEGFVLPATRKIRVVTVHSVAARIMPRFFTSGILRDNKYLGKVVKYADAVITVSESSKIDLMRLFDIKEDRIHVHHIGRDVDFQRVTDQSLLAAIRSRYRLPEKFFLFVGTIHPAKNLGGLIDAFELMIKRTACDYKLVVIGNYGWMYKTARSKLERICGSGFGMYLGYVDNKALPAIYTLAKALVFPSFYESFGIPILEAMSCGIPVVCSRNSAMPEVAGNAAIYVNPYDISGIAEAMLTMIQDEDLYSELSNQALHRSKLFSWDETAKKTLSLYRALIN